MREETRAEEEEEEEEARRRRRLKARCRAEVFEYSGVVPAHWKKHLTTTSSNASFERCVLHTQERLLERCKEEEEEEEEEENTKEEMRTRDPFAKRLERKRVEEVLRVNFEENSTWSGTYRRMNNNALGKKNRTEHQVYSDAYEASLKKEKGARATEEEDSLSTHVRVDLFCLFLYMHGINLPSAKSP